MQKTYQLPQLKSQPGLFHAFSTTAAGNMSYNWGEDTDVQTNRQSWFDEQDLAMDQAVIMQLQHGTQILTVTKADAGRGLTNPAAAPKADALMTNEPNLILCLLTADCLPAIFYDPIKRSVAIVHLGWKNLDAHLPAKVIAAMHNQFGSRPNNLIIGIGPGIHEKSYIWNSTPPQKSRAGWEPFIHSLPDNQNAIDIIGYCHSQLVTAGIKESNIEISDSDTAASPDFFSHYRSVKNNEPEGRFMTVVKLIT